MGGSGGIFGGISDIFSSVGGAISDAFNQTVGFLGGGSQVANILSGGLLTPLVGIKIPGLIDIPGALDLIPCVHWLPSVPGLGKFGNNNCDDNTDTPTGSDNSNLGPNLFHVGFYVFINEVPVAKKALVNGYYNTLVEAQDSFNSSFYPKTYEFCVDQPNSILRLIFDDVNLKDNNGYVNVKVEYLGDTECPNCKNSDGNDSENVAINYATVDALATYPVAAHGIRFVGTGDHGLSTGGRSERVSISDVEINLLQKYSQGYQIDIPTTTNINDLVKTRILDLVYKFDGSTWIRQQNLLESVYWHTGVGDDVHSIFWGGLHDSLAPFKFSYVDNTSYAPSATFADWSCRDSRIAEVFFEKKQGPEYSTLPAIVSGGCWIEPPIWEQITHGLLFADPFAVDNIFDDSHAFTEARLEYSRDPDFPDFTVLDFASGIHRFQTYDQAFSGIDFEYPEINALSISASIVSGGTFTVVSQTSGSNFLFAGDLTITGVKMDFNYLDRVYPRDVKPGSITNVQKSFAFRSFQNTIGGPRLEYGYLNSFQYIQGISGTDLINYGINGKGFIQFDSLDNMYNTAIISGQPINSIQNVMMYVSTETPTSGNLSGAKYAYGTASLELSMNDWNAVMVEVDSTRELWASSLEKCGSDIVSYLDINAENKTAKDSRWGTPLWSAVFNSGATFDLDMAFSHRDERSDGNHLTEDYEVATLSVSSDSIAAIVNRRVLIRGLSEIQEHEAIAINKVGPIGRWSVQNVSLSAEDGSPCGEVLNVINISGACFAGLITEGVSYGLDLEVTNTCTPTSATWPDHFAFNSYSPLVTSASGSQTTLIYDIIAPSKNKVVGWQFQQNNASGGCVRQFNVSFDENQCAYGDLVVNAIPALLTVDISATCCSGQGTFPTNFQLIGISGETIEGNDTISNLVQYHYFDPCVWAVASSFVISPSGYCFDASGITLNGAQTLGNPHDVVNTNVGGSLVNNCIAQTFNFPADFTYQTINQISPSLYELIFGFGTFGETFVVNINSIATGKLFVSTQECKSGQLFIDVSDCLSDCDTSAETKTIDLSTIPVSGVSYTEWSTTFVQEWHDDKRYKVPASWIQSNGYDIKPENTGVNWKSSTWKRHMDGVGLGGDAPNYDTIWNTPQSIEKLANQWRQIGGWHIGQMAFGTPLRAIVVGGHRVDRNVGRTLVGSGIHASPTTKRIFVWDTQTIPEEDTYLTNYLGRRFFSTIENPNVTVPISGTGASSDLNVIIFDAESNIIVERTGTVVFDGTNTSTAIFDKPFPSEIDVNYSIALTPNDNVEVWWTDKTVAGFTINTELADWKGEVAFLATAVINVTETDISSLGEFDGYEWNK